MNRTIKLFEIGLRQVCKDGMLVVLLPAPFITGLVFKLAIPFANAVSEERLAFSLTPWYGLTDGFLACLTPMFTAMVSVFLLLEERDEGISDYYQITPAQGYSYLAARIGIPMIWSFAVTVAALSCFNITALTFGAILSCSCISTLTGLFMAIMAVSLAENRVEGLVYSKLMGVGLLGLLPVWFVPAPYHYFGAFLPSFWIGIILTDGLSLFPFVFGVLLCFLWLGSLFSAGRQNRAFVAR